MKKLLPLLLALMLLASCALPFSGETPEKPPKGTAETVTEPEKAPADTTETPAEIPEEQPAATPEEKPDATPEEKPDATPEEKPAETPEAKPQPEAPEPVTILVYYGNDNADALLSKEATLPELTPAAVAGELIAVGVLPEGTLVNRLEVIGPFLYLDLSYEFFDKLQTMGTSGEWIMVGSVTNTFLDAYGVDSLILTANGAIIETGHVVYDAPLTRFENPEIAAVTLTVYYGDDNAEKILSKEVPVPEITPAVIMEQLISAGVLPEGCAAHYAELDGTALFVDFNDAFKTHVCTMGTSGEWIILSSVANTFLDAYAAEECWITVNNSTLETGHNLYDFPLTFAS